tara:strand:+ start:222706 stop:223020 length:315 start_codon:yes stop_codon:yes gene_type:complete
MKSFVNSRILKDKIPKINQDKCDTFIDIFNQVVEDETKYKDVFHLNTITDGISMKPLGNTIPLLNDGEFHECVRLAEEEGWTLSRSPDNYQSTTYTLKCGVTFL